ncbi:Putative fructokinase [Galdieria sulphuraria]|uniref:fructokinase n=1 Tax=Galdieria sulphuraria TaxID=130081 RepID=M2XRD8_GALSU|nr:fructokinase [Galdieria sulphuraria]EME32802.1 fructokinase [Galdieria sulphuraria]GJD12649.1 Putative fructokinase [Galdieria sulphuraria]|eukprot:XP_005709322.1 fructokinase [Galdieria sulphuraria]
MRIAGLELGGTSCVASFCEGSPTHIVKDFRVPTTIPAETIGKLKSWLVEQGPFDALGIACFGPVDLNRNSKTYGYITSTPKTQWRYVDVVGAFVDLSIPIGFDTDVNAPALAEITYGPHSYATSSSYITIGTGVGVGVVANREPIHGLMHTEGGHVMVAKLANDDYQGSCEFHGACVEGLVNAQALAARKQLAPADLAKLSDEDGIWSIAANYIAQLCANITYLLSPELIIIGGGVPKRKCLLPLVRQKFQEIVNGYLDVDKIKYHIDEYIVSSAFGDRIGMIGACELGKRALDTATRQ